MPKEVAQVANIVYSIDSRLKLYNLGRTYQGHQRSKVMKANVFSYITRNYHVFTLLRTIYAILSKQSPIKQCYLHTLASVEAKYLHQTTFLSAASKDGYYT